MVKDLSYHPPLGESDHVVLKCNVCFGQDKDVILPTHNIYKSNYEAIESDIAGHNWEELLNSNFEDDYNLFLDTLNTSLENNSPLKANGLKKKNIYMSSEAMRLKNKKRRLWKRYVESKCNYDKQTYIRCKNDLRTMTRNIRRQFEKKLAKTIKTQPKDF